MRTDLTHGKRLFFVIGPPRSGTTIVASVFNSLKDGFCLGEPHWIHEAEQGEADKEACGKMAEYWRPVADYRFILNVNVMPMLALDGFRVGGYKETFQWFRHTCDPLLEAHVPLVDFFVVVLRDPAKALSSQRALGWNHLRPKDTNKDYLRMGDLAQHHKAVVVVLEDFVGDPLGYLNARLPFRIEGPLELEPTGHRFGDPKANESRMVSPGQPGRRVSELNEKWVRALAPAIGVWERWRGAK
jgi:hypothetical protein